MLNGADSWQVFFEVEHTGLPAIATEPRVCATLNASFVDEGFGEDFVGTPVPGQPYVSFPAAFMSFALTVEGPLGEGTLAGNLDESGCVPLGTIPPQAYAFRADADPTKAAEGALDLTLVVDMRIIRRPDGVRYDVFNRFGITSLEVHRSLRPGDAPLGSWTQTGRWMVPPTRIDLPGLMLNPITNTAVAIAGLLSRSDMAIPTDDPSTPANEGFYQVEYGDGCHFIDDGGNEYIDSCYFTDTDVLYVGPGTRPYNAASCSVDADCPTVQLCFGADGAAACNGSAGCLCSWPDQSRWKYITMHEAGHQVQAHALGTTSGASYLFSCPPNTVCTGKTSGDPKVSNLFADPPFVDSMSPLCGCQHVEAANRLHCLQSIERFDNAHSEGFAQFFASKAWNLPAGGGCKFVYYKEFLDTNCKDGNTCTPFSTGPNSPPLVSNLPPLGIDCEAPMKWRNNHCPMSEASELATELDWLGFLWSLNTHGDAKTSMANLFSIYRNTCNPVPAPAAGQRGAKCEGDETLSWSSREPVEFSPRRACSTANSGCPTDHSCLNPRRKHCRDGETDCSCQTEAAFGFADGATLFYGNDPTRLQHVIDAGLRYGVTEALAP